MSVTPSFFFKSIFSRKTWRGAGKLLLKTVKKMVTPILTMLLPGPDFWAGPLALWGFSQHFLAKHKCRPNIKSDHLSAGPLALCHLVIPAKAIALRV